MTMLPEVVMPNVVGVMRAHLLDRLPDHGEAGLPVVGKVPDPRPARFVRLVRTGGSTSWPVVDRAMLTIEAWDAANDAASDALAQTVRAIVNGSQGAVVDGVAIYRVVEFSGPANVPDPESHTPRATWTAEVSLRGTT